MSHRKDICTVLGTLLVAWLLSGCNEPTEGATGEADSTGDNSAPAIAVRLKVAESMIDAFYSFDREQLGPYLSEAINSAEKILYYQGWAEGGNYKIVRRAPCVAEADDRVSCSITVEDDPVLALRTGFNVTDTFTISFDGMIITNVETSSNDQPIYYQAYDWVVENMPEIMDGPCRGFFAGGPTPGDCARAMTEGYRRFAASDDFPE